MKKPTNITNMASLLLVFLLTFFSCNNDEIFIEPQEEVIEKSATNSEEKETEDIIDEIIPDPSLPCEFNFNDVQSNSSIIINCVFDLAGRVVNLPSNVDIQVEGGEINNGTLVFSGGTIAGDLLNITLEIKGDVTLKDTKYTFNPEKWSITEGKTTKEFSLNNRKNINKAIELVKFLKGDVFEINKINAYFNVEANKVNRKYSWERSIRIPSDFHFKMSEETFLRVQPTHFPAYALITTMLTDNTIISGGNLIGDRWNHDYTPIIDIVGVNRDEHGYGHLIWVIGAHNTILDGIFVTQAIGEGIQVHAETIRQPNGTFRDGKRTSENILIKNCSITECRRNNIAIVDANGVIIDNCNILDAAIGDQAYDSSGGKVFSSAGTPPRYGIDLEALRYINDDGTMNEINRIENIIIRNSKFTGNAAGDIDLYTCNNVIVENNYFDRYIANIAANDVVIRNNTFESTSTGPTYAINIKSYKRNNIEFNYNYSITGNTIIGYANGIKMGGKNHEIKNNNIKNCETGIVFRNDFYNSTISNNIIESNVKYSYGYKCNSSQNVDKIYVSNENINVTTRPVDFIGLNSDTTLTTTQITFDDCIFDTKNTDYNIYLKSANNIEFKNNSSNTDFQITDSDNIILTNNSVSN